jgi:hypothetical protein
VNFVTPCQQYLQFSRGVETLIAENGWDSGENKAERAVPRISALLMLCIYGALDMQTKDYVYLGLIALTAVVFYWHGALSARLRARKSFVSIFNDAHSLVELPDPEVEPTDVAPGHRQVRPVTPRRGSTKIRAVFGVN